MPYLEGAPRVFYRRWSSDNPTSVVLLLHGFGEHTGHFHRLAAELTRNGSEVWGLDHVGHGLTDARDRMFDSIGQLAANANSLLDLARQTRPDLPLFIVGHSLGGLTAVEVAAERPAEVAGAVFSGPPVTGLPASLPEQLTFSLDQTYIDDIRNDPLAVSAPGSEDNLWRAVADYLPRLKDQSAKIPSPALVIFGEHDVFTTPDQAEQWARMLPSARLWVVPGGYHDILQDAMHRQVASRICDFIAAIRDRPEGRAAED